MARIKSTTTTQTVRGRSAKSKAAAAKVTPKRGRKKEEIFEDTITEIKEEQSSRSFLNRRTLFIILILVGLGLLVYNKKAWFVAATVNNQPISNFEVLQKLNTTYRERTLNQMVNEAILEQEAKKKGVSVSDDEITKKMDEVAKTYGGMEAFEGLLSQQGLTKEDFAKQTRLQLIVEKLYEQEIKPTDEEIQKFMDDNSNSSEATEPAKFKKTAEEAVKQDKLSKVFAEKFEELKKAAKISIF